MRNNSTIESLKAMRFSAMAAELERQMQDPSAYSNMGFEERLSLLVDAEWNCRQNNKLIRCIREARFAESNAVVEDIEYHEDRHLDKAQLLRFATCDFMVRFPEWLPLDKWVPQVFVASGDCAERQWDFLGLEMPQWLLGIFIAYLIVAVLVVISQPFKAKKRDLFGR